ncbi:hypothetical protein ABZ957_11360 [Streptomyces sp. NPDC046316]|uniref:hypothetical protein n=1 Tax=unclassified Streptomyces TaxID=2593676 RepID=UPI0034043919
MLTETTGRTPQDLVAELKDELAVDWLQAWRGLPQLGGREFGDLFASYGWEYDIPVHERESMVVRTRTGAHLTIGMGALFGIRSVGHYASHLKAGDPSENGAVLTRAAEDWPTYLNAVQSVLGAPTWTGPWDAPDFPEPPHRSYWPGRRFRLESRRPYQFAHWAPAGDARGRPHVVLSQSVSFPTWTTTAPGGSRLHLELWAPVEFLENHR